MQDMPWMKPDFDLRAVIAGDASGAFRASVERTLQALAERVERQRPLCRDAALRERMDGLLVACETGSAVLAAAYDAVSAV